ncbi:MAG: hypothetical protein LBN43_08580 [Oscillospiraceae bacterium]|jgi:inorganic triphosphatase YgiF|nr:hypothetical protein [Oscillospiraceae bacterium]
MASKVELKINLSGPDEANRLMSDEFFARYMKDDFQVRDVIGACYDTAFEELAAKDLRLRVRKINHMKVADLKDGKTAPNGLFLGRQWLCKFMGAFSVLDKLYERGAPKIELTAPLLPTTAFKYTRYSATLYMPDQVRAELSFDVGDSDAVLGLELLFGMGSELMLFADEFRREFSK